MGQALITVRENPVRYFIFVYAFSLCVTLFLSTILDTLVLSRLPVLANILFVTALPLPFVAWWTVKAFRSSDPVTRPLPPAHYKQGFAILMAFTLWAIGYFIVKWIVDVSDARLLPEPIESRIPFVPGSVFTYLGLYPMFIFPLLWIRDEAAFSKVIRAYTALMLFCYLIFVAYPVRIERPEFAVTTFATWALSVVYRADNPPINCLPSVHVAMVFLSAFILREIRRDVGAAALLYAAAITLCTLTTKQHYIADGVVSLIVSYAVFQFVFHPDRVAKLFTRLRPIGD